ncbi:hypothetical protein V8F20_011289 [Naviculisporaceae sp. PSN 640]
MNQSERAIVDRLRDFAYDLKEKAMKKDAEDYWRKQEGQKNRKNRIDPWDPKQNPLYLYTLKPGEVFDPRNPLHNPPDLSGLNLKASREKKAVEKTAASSRPVRNRAPPPPPTAASTRPVRNRAPPATSTTTAPPPVVKKPMGPPLAAKKPMAPLPGPKKSTASLAVPDNVMAPPPLPTKAIAAPSAATTSKATPLVPNTTITTQPVPDTTTSAQPVDTSDVVVVHTAEAKPRSKRGGARPGAGRKPKNQASKVESSHDSPAPGSMNSSVSGGHNVPAPGAPTRVSTRSTSKPPVTSTTAAPTRTSTRSTSKPPVPPAAAAPTRMSTRSTSKPPVAPQKVVLANRANSVSAASGSNQHQQPQPASASATPTPSATPAIPAVKQNGNTANRFPGRYFTSQLYLQPGAKIMAGSPWSEQEDMLLWHLKVEKQLTYNQLTPYLYPHSFQACSTRWVSVLSKLIKAMDEDELKVAEGERRRVGQLFDAGAFEYRVLQHQEAAKLPKEETEGPAKGKGKGKRKAEEISGGDEAAKDNGDKKARKMSESGGDVAAMEDGEEKAKKPVKIKVLNKEKYMRK